MKKFVCLMVMFSAIGFASSAFAAADAISTTAVLQINAAGATNSIAFGLSPKVVARYVNPGTSSVTSQWYSIGTAHPGGTTKYGTAQDLNNIYSAAYATGTAIDNTILNIATDASSASAWVNAGWELK